MHVHVHVHVQSHRVNFWGNPVPSVRTPVRKVKSRPDSAGPSDTILGTTAGRAPAP
jgi:hypothetical protein